MQTNRICTVIMLNLLNVNYDSLSPWTESRKVQEARTVHCAPNARGDGRGAELVC